mmetsp:Transcript_87443/g.154787  ORF Transcript_87443/g.154787 Transcript_87443/m.154787 type:complete len:80 (-) Transcript_87443:16-255(-)
MVAFRRPKQKMQLIHIRLSALEHFAVWCVPNRRSWTCESWQWSVNKAIMQLDFDAVWSIACGVYRSFCTDSFHLTVQCV